MSFQILGSSSQEFNDWLEEITANYEEYPTWDDMKGRYFFFLEEFIATNPSYHYPIEYGLLPETMINVLK